MILGDLSRTGVQGYELYVLTQTPESYDLRYGKTYLTAPSPLIPLWIWPGKPRSEKTIAGADLIMGRSWYVPYNPYRKSTRVYGLGGEAMLNFGWPAVPFAYAVWGFLVGRLRRRLFHRAAGDSRLLLTSLLSVLCINGLISDLDNILALLFWNILIPVLAEVWEEPTPAPAPST